MLCGVALIEVRDLQEHLAMGIATGYRHGMEACGGLESRGDPRCPGCQGYFGMGINFQVPSVGTGLVGSRNLRLVA